MNFFFWQGNFFCEHQQMLHRTCSCFETASMSVKRCHCQIQKKTASKTNWSPTKSGEYVLYLKINQSIKINQINHTSIPSITLKKALVLILFVIVFNHKSNTFKYRFLAMKHPKVIGACLFTVWSVLEAMQTSVPTWCLSRTHWSSKKFQKNYQKLPKIVRNRKKNPCTTASMRV